MSTDLEQALRSAFRDAAETVVPDPYPMRRLLQRRRRRWAGLGAFFAAIAVVAGVALVPALQLGTPERRGAEGYKITSPWTRNMLQSPTRGSLSGTPLLAEVEREIRARGDKSPLDRVKVLFLGDVAGRRFVAYARYNDANAALYYNDGAPGDPAARLVAGGSADLRLDPLIRLTSPTAPAFIGLAPADCRIATSRTGIVSGNSAVTRDWTTVPLQSWVTYDTHRPAERWRVTCGAGVTWEGPAAPVDELTDGADPVAAGGLTHGAVVQRWAGPIEGTGRTWTLTTTLLSGGGVAAVLTSGTSGKSTVATDLQPEVSNGGDPPADPDGWDLTSTAISSDPNVVAVRVPVRSGGHTYYSDRVLIVASTPGAWSVLVPSSPGFYGTYLDNGVTVLRTDGGVVAIKNVTDVDVGWTYVADRHDVPEYLGEKIVSSW